MAEIIENAFFRGSDICKCGDFRSQHANGKRCAVGDCTCPKFDFYSVGAPADQAVWKRRHGPRASIADEMRSMVQPK